MIIAIEGADGSGKSTQASMLAQATGYGLQRFPDRSTPVGKLIDKCLRGELVLAEPGCQPNPLENALMFQALQTVNRLELGRRLALAATDAAHLVCDRYYQSAVVYGTADGLDSKYLEELHRFLPQATVNVLIRVPAPECRRRIEARGGALERYETDPGLLERLVAGYDALWLRHKPDHHWITVDGRGTPEEVLERVLSALGVIP